MKTKPKPETTTQHRLAKIVEAFPRLTVAVLGDLVADEFVFGEISRVSREAPVLILKHRERNVVPGGGANAIYNLAEPGTTLRSRCLRIKTGASREDRKSTRLNSSHQIKYYAAFCFITKQ